MTVADISNNKARIGCFHCRSILGNFPNAKFIVLCDDNGEVIQIKHSSEEHLSPMVFCSSDCMVYDCHLRYIDRVQHGTFRKKFNVSYYDKLPDNWQEEKPEIVNKRT